MSQVQVYVVRTGIANIGSIVAALQRTGASVSVGDDPTSILSFSRVVVPGVGTFGAAMKLLKETNCDEAVKTRVAAKLPTFFICVGMQIMGSSSEESEAAVGLNIFEGKVTRFPNTVQVPQHGWNHVVAPTNSRFIQSGFAYFSNSFKLSTAPSGWEPAHAKHGEIFVAAVEQGPIIGCQFHPELSGKWGFDLLHRWVHNIPVQMASRYRSMDQLIASSEVLTTDKITNKARRIIPCLDVKDGQVVKGIKFQNLQGCGVPAERAALYELQGADELVVLDVSATIEARKTRLDTVKAVRNVLSIPLTVGGGVKTVEDARQILEAGADKVGINTAAVRNPEILSEMALQFGNQCTVLSLDAAECGEGKWEVVVNAGKERTGLDAVEWAKEAVSRGAGEILLTSWDRDGTGSGYDLKLIEAISKAVHVPVIASGGASAASHLVDAFQSGADAVLAASIFHYGEHTVEGIKREISLSGISLRI